MSWKNILKNYDLPRIQDFNYPESTDIQRGLFLANYFADNESELNEQIEQAMLKERSEESLRRAILKIIDDIPNSQSTDYMILVGQLKLDTFKGFSEHQNDIPSSIVKVLESMEKEFDEIDSDANS